MMVNWLPTSNCWDENGERNETFVIEDILKVTKVGRAFHFDVRYKPRILEADCRFPLIFPAIRGLPWEIEVITKTNLSPRIKGDVLLEERVRQLMEELKEPGSQLVNNPRREDEENGDIIDIDSGRPEVMRNIVIVKEFEIKKQEFSIDRRRNSMIKQEKSLKEDDDRIKMVLSFSGIGATVFQSIGGDSISYDSLRTLDGHNWINDEVISFFMRMLKIRDANRCSMDSLRKPIHFFNSFFFKKIVNIDGKYVFNGVHKWTKKQIRDIFSLEKLIVPVHVEGNHWALICVHFQSKRICYLDSLNRGGLHFLKLMRQYLKDEWRNGIHGTEGEFPWLEWKLQSSSTLSIPQQRNNYDCGVFTCMFAVKLSNDEDMLFNQEDVTKFRKEMFLNILDGEVEQTNLGIGVIVLDEIGGILRDSRDVSNEERSLKLYD
jgi:hypothetical protein